MVDKRGLKRATLEILSAAIEGQTKKSEGRTATRSKTINLRFGVFIRLEKSLEKGDRRKRVKKKTERTKKKKKREGYPIERTVFGSRKTRYKVIVLLH